MLIAVVPVLFALAGLLAYALSSNPKVAEVGRLVFATAFLALMLELARHTIRIGT